MPFTFPSSSTVSFAADAADEKTVKFTNAYKAANNGEIPNQFAADAYDAVYTVAAALEKANITVKPDTQTTESSEN